MKLARRTLGLLAAAILVAAACWFWWPRTFRGTDLLPATTSIYVQIPNVAATTAHWAQTQAAVITKSSEDTAVRETSGLMTKRWSSLFETVRHGAVELAGGEVFIALTGLQTTPRIVPQLAVGIQVGHHGPQAQQWLDQLKRQLKRDFPASSFSDERYFQTGYQRWQLEPGLEICAATLGDKLIFTLCAAPMMDILDRYRDSSRATLSGSGSFLAACARLPKQADWRMAVQTESLKGTLDPFLQWMPQLQALAAPLAQLDAIGAAQVFDGGQVRDVLTVAHKAPPSQPRRGFKSALLERLPASCIAGAMADVTAADVYSLVNQATLTLGNRDWMKAQLLFEAGWSAQQINFTRDVLGMLDTPTAVALDWPSGQRRLAVLFGAPLREPERLAAIMRRFDGAPQPPPMRWRVVNGWLWLSFSEESLERVSRTANGSAPGWQMTPQGPASPTADSGWLWFVADTGRFAMTPDNAVAKPLLIAVTSRHGRFDETLAVSPFGSIVSAWLAIEAANQQAVVKK